ncbi:MAG: bacterial Ig-like domain-containing protein [Spirochaetaceae bacterium]|jgi:hypothetical protein|nr:bacterial Ig-like domain-containing protein [Spirochaetaceae bacterium]
MMMDFRRKWRWIILAAALFVSCGQPGDSASEDENEFKNEAEPAAQKIGIKISSPPDTTVYGRGQAFDKTGLAVDWLYEDGSAGAMAESEWLIAAEPDMTKYIPHKVTVRAAAYAADKNYEDSFWIAVMDSDRVLQSVTASGPANKTQYVGFELDKTGLVITGHFSDGSTQNLTSYAAVLGYDKRRRGEQQITARVNGKTAVFTVTTRIGDAASVTINKPFRYQGPDDHQNLEYKEAWIKGEAFSVKDFNLQALVKPGGVGSVTLTYPGGINDGDLEPVMAAYRPEQTGKQTLTVTLDGRTFDLELFVLDVEPAVWFDYGYMRHAGDGTGKGPGAGKYYARPNETLVIAPVRYLVGYNADHTPAAGTTYAWTVSGDAASRGYTMSNDGELLHITPKSAGTYTVSVKIAGKNYLTGETIEKTASTELVCYTGALPAGTFASPLRNFACGQFSEGGNGLGWSLGSAGGYEVWTVEHQPSYKISGNAFSSWHEAGVVWMQEDRNGNGLPDEMWYEVRGGDDDDPAQKGSITRRYAITYIKGSESEAVINQYNQLIRPVYWADVKGRAGRIPGGFPDRYWGVTGNRVTYTGTLLRDNGNIATGSYSGLAPMPGYVDALGDTFQVDKAMRADGSPVTLSAVKFIKVQTAVLRYGGSFGDVSTEIYSADFLGVQTNFPLP